MQNRYAGDIGDFGKFFLLRKLFGDSDYQIGVVWYLFPDESHNNDGIHISYLCNNEYKNSDKDLIEKLTEVVKNICNRSVAQLETMKLLPNCSNYYSEPLDFYGYTKNDTKGLASQRKKLRENWLKKALNYVNECNVVFLDPDNGLEIKSVPTKARKNAGKYVFYDEVAAFLKNDKTKICVIYHHLSRNDTHQVQIESRATELKQKMLENDVQDCIVFALRFRPYSARAYFILSAKSEANLLRDKIEEFLTHSCEDNSVNKKSRWDLCIEVK